MKFVIDSPKYGKHTVEIDNEDAVKVMKYKWCIHYEHKSGRRRLIGVITNVRKNGKHSTPALHQIILPGCKMIDHKNANPLDNRKENLRACSSMTNTQNAKRYSSNKSGYKGVCEYEEKAKYTHKGKTKTYIYKRIIAQIMVNKKQMFLGYFRTKEDAARAYNAAAVKHFGEFARLNEI